jgi:hypothetical protein
MAQVKMSTGPGRPIRFVRRGGVWRAVVPWGEDVTTVVLEWVGITALACMIIAAGEIVGLYRATPAFDTNSKVFADASVNAIAPSWNEEALFARATPDFAASASGDFNRYFHTLRGLGSGAKSRGCQGGSMFDPLSRAATVTARYTCEIEVKNQQALVALSLRKDLDAWRISGFYVSTPAAVRSQTSTTVRPGTGRA